MYTRTDLLDICFSLGISAEEEMFYRFAQAYIFGMQERSILDTKHFFQTIEYCKNNAATKSIGHIMGFSGNGNSANIISWCKKILNYSELKKLNISELNMLMGYCSRQAKIKENGL